MSARIKKELQAAKRELKALSKRVEKIMVALEKNDKPKATKKASAAPKSTKKVVAKISVPKKRIKITASETVLKIIPKLKRGANTTTLMKKTGFNQRKVANIVFNLKKQKKIISPNKGLYMKA